MKNKIQHPLKDTIKKKYKSLNRFCDELGIEKQVLYYFFKGRTKYLRDDTKMMLMDALDIDIKELWEILYGTN